MLVVGITSAYEITSTGKTESFRPAVIGRQAEARAEANQRVQSQVIAEFAGGNIVDAVVEIDDQGREITDEQRVIDLANVALVGASL